MLKRILGCALLAGVIAGGASAVLQQWLVIPVLLEAELYESGEAVHFGAAPETTGLTEHEPGVAATTSATETEAHSHLAAGGPNPGRVFTTVIATIGFNVGLAAFLVALFYLRDARPTIREGIVWGLYGFAVQVIAPSLGLPPELPGVAAADLTTRQIWWVATIISSGLGIWLIAFGRQAWTTPLAILLLLAPHVIGAPHPDKYAGTAPPEIALLWVGRTIGIAFISWVLLGAVAAAVWSRFNRAAA